MAGTQNGVFQLSLKPWCNQMPGMLECPHWGPKHLPCTVLQAACVVGSDGSLLGPAAQAAAASDEEGDKASQQDEDTGDDHDQGTGGNAEHLLKDRTRIHGPRSLVAREC